MACNAIREVQSGHINIDEFVPPLVFKSGLYKQYGVTVSDLRWHLLTCVFCASMNEPRLQLRILDEARFIALTQGMGSLENAIEGRLRREKWLAKDLAEDIANDYLKGEGIADDNLRESIIECEGEEFYQQARIQVYLWAVRLHVLVGEIVLRWLETLLPPKLSRIFTHRGGEIQDVRINVAPIRPVLSLARDLIPLVSKDGSKAATLLIRAILLRDAFSSVIEDADLKRLLEEGNTPTLRTQDTHGVDWERIWDHYTAFSELQARQLATMEAERPTGGIQLTPEVIQRITQSITPMLSKMGEGIEDLLSGQTAIMDRISEIESAQRRLQEDFERSSIETKAECEATIKSALGSLFQKLTAQTRRFLFAAEYGYTHSPDDIDFSGVVVCYTKAFECEFRRAVEPIRDKLQKVADNDPYFRKDDLRNSPLGNFLKLFKRNESAIENLLRPHGLVLRKVTLAIETVNLEKGAKHLEPKSKSDATSFRTLFLGKSSVIAVLFPPTV